MVSAIIFDVLGVLDGRNSFFHDHDFMPLCIKLKEQGIIFFVLSNSHREIAEHHPYLKKFVTDIATKAYFSDTSIYMKPEKESFTQILSEFDIDPKQCLFIDDGINNIASAKELGIQTHLYGGFADGMKILKELLRV